MNTIRQLCRQAALIVPALTMLLGASIAWGQTQILSTQKVHTMGKLLLLDFGEKDATVDNPSDPARDFEDIAYLPTGLDLLAIDGILNEVLMYSGGTDAAATSPKSILTGKNLGLKSLRTISVNPETSKLLVTGLAKGKPVFHAYLCDLDGGNCSADPVAKDFPRPVASDFVPAQLAGTLKDGGFLVAGTKELVFLKASDSLNPVTVATKKLITLAGNEQITDVAWLSDDVVLIGTNHRRLLTVNLSNNTTTAIVEDGTGGSDCESARDQIMSVAVIKDEQETFILSGDFACGKVTQYSATGTKIGGFVLPVDPDDPDGNPFMPEGVAVAEGEALNLSDCVPPKTCDFAPPDAAGDPVAPVTLQSFTGSPDAVLRHVPDMRDCRCGFIEDDGITVNPPTCPIDSVLNLVDLLPDEVVNLGIVQDPTYIPSRLQGDPFRSCKLGAFIVDTPPGTRTGIIEGLWEVHELLDELPDTRCETGVLRDENPDIEAILDWDLTGYAPTNGVTVCNNCTDDSDPPVSVPTGSEITLATHACGSSGMRGRGFSVIMYGLSIPSDNNPKVLVEFTDELIIDLGTAINELAKPLLSTPHDMILDNRYNNILDKWTKAKNALINQPNAADTTLSAVVSQLNNLRDDNEPLNYGADPDNIQGEIDVRPDVLVFLINERLRQSVPLDGF